ncbi:MAG: hypothetical protein V3U85_02560, partial [Hyphomicrobium sp.]
MRSEGVKDARVTSSLSRLRSASDGGGTARLGGATKRGVRVIWGAGMAAGAGAIGEREATWTLGGAAGLGVGIFNAGVVASAIIIG